MLAEKAQDTAMTDPGHRASFFRQSGWLMFANIAGGFFMFAVHLLNKAIPPGEYGNFGVLLAVVMLLPTIPLQMVLAQQTAKLLGEGRRRELSGVIRLSLLVTFVAWVIGSAVVLALQNRILASWNMSSPVGLWITLPIVLLSLWLPLFWGVLQGTQNFLWWGWTMLITALGRISVATFAVLVLHAYAAGMMCGVLLGIAAAVAVAAWQTRSLWLPASEASEWRSLWQQVLPLLLAFLGFQILFTADTIMVKSYFDKVTVDFYVSAGTMSRALMWLVTPLAAVMFPRLVHSRPGKGDLLSIVLAGTAVLAIVGAIGVSVVGPWVVRLVYKEEYVRVAAAILPWYTAAMIPLALGNVLLNNLLARPASKLLLAVCVFVLAVAYLVAITQFHASLVMVLRVMGGCNLVLFLVCAWFNWGRREARAESGETGGASSPQVSV